jgi:uncharacterized protein with ATP-grasp and redox domains
LPSVAGLSPVAIIVDNGSNASGMVITLCSQNFCHLLTEADLIVAKDQANCEALSKMAAHAFFLLQAKCPVIAGSSGISDKSIVLN